MLGGHELVEQRIEKVEISAAGTKTAFISLGHGYYVIDSMSVVYNDDTNGVADTAHLAYKRKRGDGTYQFHHFKGGFANAFIPLAITKKYLVKGPGQLYAFTKHSVAGTGDFIELKVIYHKVHESMITGVVVTL